MYKMSKEFRKYLAVVPASFVKLFEKDIPKLVKLLESV
jgi:hypothetical protein